MKAKLILCFFYIYFTTFIICFLFRLLLHHFLFPLTTPAVFVVIESTKLVMRYVIIDWRKDLPIQIGFLAPTPPILFHLVSIHISTNLNIFYLIIFLFLRLKVVVSCLERSGRKSSKAYKPKQVRPSFQIYRISQKRRFML